MGSVLPELHNFLLEQVFDFNNYETRKCSFWHLEKIELDATFKSLPFLNCVLYFFIIFSKFFYI